MGLRFSLLINCRYKEELCIARNNILDFHYKIDELEGMQKINHELYLESVKNCKELKIDNTKLKITNLKLMSEIDTYNDNKNKETNEVACQTISPVKTTDISTHINHNPMINSYPLNFPRNQNMPTNLVYFPAQFARAQQILLAGFTFNDIYTNSKILSGTQTSPNISQKLDKLIMIDKGYSTSESMPSSPQKSSDETQKWPNIDADPFYLKN